MGSIDDNELHHNANERVPSPEYDDPVDSHGQAPAVEETKILRDETANGAKGKVSNKRDGLTVLESLVRPTKKRKLDDVHIVQQEEHGVQENNRIEQEQCDTSNLHSSHDNASTSHGTEDTTDHVKYSSDGNEEDNGVNHSPQFPKASDDHKESDTEKHSTEADQLNDDEERDEVTAEDEVEVIEIEEDEENIDDASSDLASVKTDQDILEAIGEAPTSPESGRDNESEAYYHEDEDYYIEESD